MPTEIQIVLGVLATSILSGVLGMGGGMILMALYSSILPVKLAMILHGITQFAANGFRAHIHRSDIKWQVVMPYVLGGSLIFVLFKAVEIVPNKPVIFLLLGSFPFISLLPFLSGKFSITGRGRPFACGIFVTAAQLLAGASGAILDIFFVNSPLSRHEIIATKAFTQSIGHTIKLIYYFSLITSVDEFLGLSPYVYPSVIFTAYVGTNIGKVILDKLSDHNFKKISRTVILIIAATLLYRGCVLALRR